MSKFDDLLSSIGLIAPAKTKFHENYQDLNTFIMDLSKIELKKNRTDNSSIIRSRKDFSGDISFEKINTKHFYSYRSIAADGAG